MRPPVDRLGCGDTYDCRELECRMVDPKSATNSDSLIVSNYMEKRRLSVVMDTADV